jgi:hypothetical protein
MVLHLAPICLNGKLIVKNKSETLVGCSATRPHLTYSDQSRMWKWLTYRIHGGLRNWRARNLERRRRRTARGGLRRGANGGARNIDPKSAPSAAPSDVLPEVERNLDVISVWLALPAPTLDFFVRRATAMKRDTRLGTRASAAARTNRDTDFAA